jgi:hypothetical protein
VKVFFLVEHENNDTRRINAPAKKMILRYEIWPGTVLRVKAAEFIIRMKYDLISH